MTGPAIGRGLRAIALALLLPTLASCGPSSPNNFIADIPNPGLAQQDRGATADRRIAITHRFSLRVPNAETEAIQQKHMAECTRLGCSILSTSVDRSNEGRINARATVRIKPESYDAFAALLASPPAQVTGHSQSGEDVTLPILDAEKRLEAKTVLRDRLTAMLRDQSAKTAADLVTIEKELAQVQGDIESIVAQRDSLRTRTDTMRIDISYAGAVGQYGSVDLTPIYQAARGINQTVVSSIAWLISSLVALVPWLPVIALFWWIARRVIRRWRVPKAPTG
jgi:hypothetical protein